MAHELEINEDGQARMFYAGQTPWHGLGTQVDSELTAVEAIRAAQLDWELKKQEIYISGTGLVDGIPVIGTKVPGKYAVVRPLDNKVLGVVGESYEIIQNRECFAFLDEIVGSGQAIYHTAGSLFGGSRVFVTIKLPNDAHVGDDVVEKYVVLSTSHDGTIALNARISPIRVVCANTLAVALNEKTAESICVRHTTNYAKNVEEARKVLKLTDVYYAQMEVAFYDLLKQSMSDTQMDSFLTLLIPDTKKDGDKLIATGRSLNIRKDIKDKFHDGIGMDNIQNTRWAAYNAVTEYVTHDRATAVHGDRKESDVKLTSMLYGSGQRLTQKAYDLLAV